MVTEVPYMEYPVEVTALVQRIRYFCKTLNNLRDMTWEQFVKCLQFD